jgi:long-chain acyl-CoA synthetase
MANRKKKRHGDKKYPAGIAWDVHIPQKPLFTLLDEAVERFSDHNCINFFGKTSTYAEISDLVDRVAKGLQEHDVKKGDRVGLFLPNCPYAVIAYYAILKVGATVVHLSPLSTFAELSHHIEETNMKIVFSVDINTLYAKLTKLMQGTSLEYAIIGSFEACLPFPKNKLFRWFKRDDIADVPYGRVKIAWDQLVDNDGKYTPVEIVPEKDIALLQCTGGTTGTPKAAELTHYNLYANTIQCGMWFVGLNEGEEKMAGVIPLFHAFAMTVVMNMGIHKGCELVLYPKPDMIALLNDIKKYKISLLPGVPTLFHAMCLHKSKKGYDFSSLKISISGGAPLAPSIRKEFEELTDSRLVEGYGLTEASPVVSANPLDGSGKDGSIGLPFPATSVEIRALDDDTCVMPVGEKGELYVKGPQVMKGYLNNEEETQLVLQDGWLRTGDIAYVDDDGYVFIAGRLKEMIITAGYNVYPREIEDTLLQCHKIEEVAVIGVEDKLKGQVAKAYVVVRTGEEVTADELKKLAAQKLTKYKVPEIIEVVEFLPKTPVGKVDKKILEANHAAAIKAKAEGLSESTEQGSSKGED